MDASAVNTFKLPESISMHISVPGAEIIRVFTPEAAFQSVNGEFQEFPELGGEIDGDKEKEQGEGEQGQRRQQNAQDVTVEQPRHFLDTPPRSIAASMDRKRSGA